MMMIKKTKRINSTAFLKIVLLLVPFFLVSQARAQDNDFGVWYSISARYEIFKNLQIDVSEEVRTASKASEVDQYFTEAGLSYKLNKYVSFGGYYRYIRKRETKDDFYARNRFYGELDLTYPLARFEFSYRFRFQRQTNKYADDVEEKAPRLYNRHKFGIEYNIRGFKLTPSVFYERFYRLKYISAYFSDSERYGIDLNYKFNKKHRAGVGFLIDKDLHPNIDYLRVATVSYRYSFN
jgi:hypothetical protein